MKTMEHLIAKMDQSSLTRLDLEYEGLHICMEKEKVQVTNHPPIENLVTCNIEPPKKKENGAYIYVTSPMVGTFYACSAPDQPPYVTVGDHVKKGQIICIIESMKLMNEIEAEVSGEVKAILVSNQGMVEYGQKMFEILPD